jgi:hypothetical protein
MVSVFLTRGFEEATETGRTTRLTTIAGGRATFPPRVFNRRSKIFYALNCAASVEPSSAVVDDCPALTSWLTRSK